MKQNDLNEYKKGIREKYEEQKTGVYCSYLSSPSPANLRNLCMIIFRDNKNSDDLRSFEMFFGFQFDDEGIKEFGDEKKLSKFKPIGKFLTQNSGLTNISGLDLTAMLVDFTPRPFNKFSKTQYQSLESKLPLIEVVSENEKNVVLKPNQAIVKSETTSIIEPIENKQDSFVIPKKAIIMVTGVIAASLFIYCFIIPKKDCMRWENDHYEAVSCSTVTEQKMGFIQQSPVLPKDDYTITHLKKIKVNNQTSFFNQDGSPKVWYGKGYSGEYEYFSHHGLHPETGQTLKKITPYIIDKHILKK